MFYRRICLLSLLVLALALPLHAQEEDSKKFSGEITVTATGTEEDSSTVPAAVTIISSKEIEDSQVSDLPELLRRVPSMIVMSAGGVGNQTSVFTRGSESDHTLVMIDGVRLNSPYFGGFDFSQVSTAGLERIEVVRGPSSALWGSDAIGGVINLVPQRARQGLHGQFLAESGSDSWERYQGTFSYASEGFDLLATGLKHEGDSNLENSDFDLETGLIDAGWSFKKESRVGILFFQNDSELGIPFASPGNPSPLRRQKNRQQTMALPFSWKINSEWRLESTLSHVSNEFRFSDPDDAWGFTSQATDTDTDQAHAILHTDRGLHHLSFGGEWRSDEVDDASSYGVNLESKGSDSSGLFLQDDWSINSSTRLLAGVRWDSTDEWGSEFSPRLGIGWKLARGYDLRLNYGEAFRQPSVGELYFPGSGNPDLQPETSKSWEISLGRLKGKSSPNEYRFNYFHTEIDDLINFDYISYSMLNIGKATIDGIEFIVDTTYTEDISSTLQLSWLDAKDGDDQDLLRRPEWSGTFTLRGAFSEAWRGDLNLLYVGERPDIDALSFEEVTSPGFVTVDLALGFRLSDTLTLRLRGRNLLDRDYAEINGYPAPGRRIIFGLKAAF